MIVLPKWRIIYSSFSEEKTSFSRNEGDVENVDVENEGDVQFLTISIHAYWWMKVCFFLFYFYDYTNAYSESNKSTFTISCSHMVAPLFSEFTTVIRFQIISKVTKMSHGSVVVSKYPFQFEVAFLSHSSMNFSLTQTVANSAEWRHT